MPSVLVMGAPNGSCSSTGICLSLSFSLSFLPVLFSPSFCLFDQSFCAIFSSFVQMSHTYLWLNILSLEYPSHFHHAGLSVSQVTGHTVSLSAFMCYHVVAPCWGLLLFATMAVMWMETIAALQREGSRLVAWLLAYAKAAFLLAGWLCLHC